MEDGKTSVTMAPRQTDDSWMTLVQTNSSDGLEVKSGLLGKWLPVSNAVPGSLFVMTGEVLDSATQMTIRMGPGEKHLSRQKCFYKPTNYRIRRIPHSDKHDHHRITLMNMLFVYAREADFKERAESFMVDDIVVDDNEIDTV